MVLAGLPRVRLPATPTLAILSRVSSPAWSTEPKTVDVGSISASRYTMKNWLSLVLGPDWAIATVPRG